MARQLSGQQENLKVGISSFSEEKTSLKVIGKVGIGTEDAMQPLHIEGNAYVSGNISIGISQAEAPGAGNTSVLTVGILTANQIFGSIGNITGIVTSATNVAGGDDGKLVIQSEVGVTSFFDYGSTNQVLVSRGNGLPPHWAPATQGGAIDGIFLFEEGSQVGAGNSYGGLDFRGSAITVVGAPGGANIGTITVSGHFADGMTIENGLNVTGVSTLTGNAEVTGDLSVTGDITFGGNAVPSVAMILALGGF